MTKLLKVAPLALALMAAACTLSQTGKNDVLSYEQIAQQLAQSPSGQGVLAWLNGLAPKAQAAIQKVNAKLGIGVDDVKAMCGFDNTVHSLVQLALVLAPQLPSAVMTADNIGYVAIQDTCALATAGTLPSATQIQTLVTYANDLSGLTKPAQAVAAQQAAARKAAGQ
ncbi:MAG TPA: hypothetical protein VFA12_20025 [Stellaceae bacterium]|nr:hypothetical protein [Stellaceae bacterium]